MLGDAEELKAEYMLVEDYHITEMQDLLQCKDLSVRIRYRSKPIPCQVLVLDEKQLLVRFLSEASAIAPGQSAGIDRQFIKALQSLADEDLLGIGRVRQISRETRLKAFGRL